jgi:hypothetical protein
MHNAVLAAAVVALSGVVLFARLRIGFIVVVATTILIPASLQIRNPITPYALFTRVLVVALAIRLLFALRAGEVPRPAMRWTIVHTAFVVFLAGMFVAGVLLADPSVKPGPMEAAAVLLVDQFVFFVVVLACVRAIGDLRWVLGVVGAVLLVSAGIGVIEHFTHGSWGHFLFGRQVSNVTASSPLSARLDTVRVRAGAEYALQYGWVTVMLLPALLAWLGSTRMAVKRWIPLAILGVGVVLLAEYWSYARTAFAAFGVIALVTAFAARNKPLMWFTGAGLALGIVLFILVSPLQHGFVGLPSGPVDVRTERLPIILQIGLYHPLHGIGLGGLASYGLPNTDSTYLQLYGDGGIIGLIAGLALLVTAAVSCVRGLRASDHIDRLAAGAALAASVAMLVGGVAYDALRSLGSARPFWLLVACGIVAAERAAGPLPAIVRRPRWLLAGAVVGAEVVGLVVFALAPVHYAIQYQFQTVSVLREALPSNPLIVGQTYLNTVCADVAGVKTLHADARFDCRDLKETPGVGQLRVQAGSPDQVKTLVADVSNAVNTSNYIDFSLAPQTSLRSGRDTGLAWAPFWLPVGTLLALVLLPVGRRPRQGA